MHSQAAWLKSNQFSKSFQEARYRRKQSRRDGILRVIIVCQQAGVFFHRCVQELDLGRSSKPVHRLPTRREPHAPVMSTKKRVSTAEQSGPARVESRTAGPGIVQFSGLSTSVHGSPQKMLGRSFLLLLTTRFRHAYVMPATIEKRKEKKKLAGDNIKKKAGADSFFAVFCLRVQSPVPSWNGARARKEEQSYVKMKICSM